MADANVLFHSVSQFSHGLLIPVRPTTLSDSQELNVQCAMVEPVGCVRTDTAIG